MNGIRRNLFGLAIPVTAALIANAPFIAVMIKSPTADEREEMLTEWCKGDYCTLLGGGAGFSSSSNGGTYDNAVAQRMPSSEEFEALAREAAEINSSSNE
eukprot:CAMPEP_0194143944 /NCGR_PEP_ID=MMETSP0152-20130528/13041_1 /TAXON_ID=1049557 /ORGANISM="Thalassiothrix antarctica, Strain L6-D1" /LENGTH=99 /DNA_ID=CAMNT_0038843573 /DNA_START=269 /DNA_END=568 /DNA_ORIENTATION=+